VGIYGLTIPLSGVPLHKQRETIEGLADLGYTDVWSAESDGADAFTPLALAAAWEPRLRLGTAIVPAFTRAPACLAQSVAAMADAAPGRFAFGIGSSSNVIVERWNGVPFVEPYKRVRDMVRPERGLCVDGNTRALVDRERHDRGRYSDHRDPRERCLSVGR
jgi:alkanesulfonate monooxygenase SsuD/methylene tetrahydromethanopterin reductase-like flavin-dependent oxidoreductase (luciferase family)